MADILLPQVRKHFGWVMITCMALFLIGLAFHARPVDASKSLVTVYADNQERVISTTVMTVGEALERAGVQLGEHDLVEPGLDSFINEAVFKINVYRARPVTVVDGTNQKTIMSPYQSPRRIAEEAGYKVYDEDAFSFELIDDILQTGAIGQRLVIDRATPVKINLYGDELIHRTHLDTVGEVLKEAGIVVGDSDTLKSKPDQAVDADKPIMIVREGTDVVVEEVAVPFETEYIYDSNMFTGERQVKEPGQTGTDLVTYTLELANGQEVARTLSQSVRKSEPKTEIVVVGTKIIDPASNTAIGQAMAAQKGWVGAEWQCLYSLWERESHWNHLASNGGSGAYGIPQALPGSKMASAGADWQSNPATQIAWGLSYIEGRHGTPCGAWEHSELNGWY